MSTSRASSRTCSICGASNSPLSLFCAECGSALNDTSSQETGAIGSASGTGRGGGADSSQPTQSLSPAAPNWSPGKTASIDTPSSTQASTRDWNAPATSFTGSAAVDPSAKLPWADAPQAPGRTGFVLGVLATLIIIAVIALFIWASLLDPETRDTISGFFDFIG